MGFHPVNLALRFLLELSALVAMGVWGWRLGDGPGKYAYAFLIPFAAMAVWGVFAVPGDRSRSGKAPVAVGGKVRLGVEIAFFTLAVFALTRTGSGLLTALFAAAISIHYLASYDRIAWLLRA